METETQQCQLCGYPIHLGHSPECQLYNSTRKENVPKSNIEEITDAVIVQAEQVKIRDEDRNENGELLVYPGGPVSNLPEQEWRMTRTEAFQEWFKESMILDENDEPLILYHGSDKNFKKFDTQSDSSENRDSGYFGQGSYFTPNKDLALSYGPVIYKTFLNIKNLQTFSIEDGNVRFRDKPLPKEIHEEVFKKYEPRKNKRLEALQKEKEENRGNWSFVSTWNGEEDFEDLLSEIVREVLIEKGINGAMGYNPTSRLYEYVAFEPDDIMIIPDKK